MTLIYVETAFAARPRCKRRKTKEIRGFFVSF